MVRTTKLIVLVIGLLAGPNALAQNSPPGGSSPEAVAVLMPLKDSGVGGKIVFRQRLDHVAIQGTVTGLKPGKHGFHIHEFGDLRADDGASAGGHFNPDAKPHGALEAAQRHAGDMGNIDANEQGNADVDIRLTGVKLGQLLGRSLVVHQDPDDLTTQPSGNAGPRIAAGVIGLSQPPPPIAPAGPPPKLDINSASLSDIQGLPGVSASQAARIFAGKPYRSFDDLMRNDIPATTIDALRDRITFGP